MHLLSPPTKLLFLVSDLQVHMVRVSRRHSTLYDVCICVRAWGASLEEIEELFSYIKTLWKDRCPTEQEEEEEEV